MPLYNPVLAGLPAGGTDGQVLTKQSATNFDADWETPAGGSSQPSAKYLSITPSISAFVGTLDLAGDTVLEQVHVENSAFEAADLSGCTALTHATLPNNTSLQTLDVSDCSSLVRVSANGSSSLTSADISSSAANLIDVSFSGCALTVTAVNAILVALDANGLEDGEVDLGAGTNAEPTGAGATAVTNLTNKGWDVTVNGGA